MARSTWHQLGWKKSSPSAPPTTPWPSRIAFDYVLKVLKHEDFELRIVGA